MSPVSNKSFRGNSEPYIKAAKERLKLKTQEELIEIEISMLIKGE